VSSSFPSPHLFLSRCIPRTPLLIYTTSNPESVACLKGRGSVPSPSPHSVFIEVASSLPPILLITQAVTGEQPNYPSLTNLAHERLIKSLGVGGPITC
jgi:hypothetical protein